MARHISRSRKASRSNISQCLLTIYQNTESSWSPTNPLGKDNGSAHLTGWNGILRIETEYPTLTFGGVMLKPPLKPAALGHTQWGEISDYPVRSEQQFPMHRACLPEGTPDGPSIFNLKNKKELSLLILNVQIETGSIIKLKDQRD